MHFSKIAAASTVLSVAYGLSGQATFYGGNVQGGTCSFSTYTLPSGLYGTALSDSNWANSAECGSCVSVTGPSGNSITAMIVDQCPGCGTNHLDLFTDAFTALASESAGIIDVTWSYVDCPITSPLEVHNKEGVSANWFSMQVVNANQAVESLEVSTDGGSTWLTTTRQTYNFFQISSGTGTTTVDVKVTSANGDVVTINNVSISSGASTTASSNFGTSASSNTPASSAVSSVAASSVSSVAASSASSVATSAAYSAASTEAATQASSSAVVSTAVSQVSTTTTPTPVAVTTLKTHAQVAPVQATSVSVAAVETTSSSSSSTSSPTSTVVTSTSATAAVFHENPASSSMASTAAPVTVTETVYDCPTTSSTSLASLATSSGVAAVTPAVTPSSVPTGYSNSTAVSYSPTSTSAVFTGAASTIQGSIALMVLGSMAVLFA
ncbi:hypothetical protein BP6252_05824 [Coleophoma cylindrospora]|uniref:Expansin-like EG45 domain-containing protein n=1 Tax=Coleophoma cylindrospora TaxID=1849047 RepID=A0A3D8RVE1_9HELO|nr:hypothetical protein BP6252_05824 [Coleophoma cylindrospora]